ncbi:hypothetical protein [Roseococcus sp. YIM B11640]|uniref:hypothetical protein n=1 Tax=Roseococcus sp. YIM B11640 TaxID=3133973 RepID=UPI003C7BBC0A
MPERDRPWLSRLAWLVAALALAHGLYVLFGWLNEPLLDRHAFRQTQTALSTYWIAQGGPILAYDTPVLGAPWAIPFEAPVYHAVVALVSKLGVPMDAAGRLVSFGFLLAAAWPIRMLWRDLELPPAGFPMLCALLLASPLYLFWARTFLIESCAWFFAVLWLACFVRWLRGEKAALALAAVLAGSLATLAKATTFPSFALVGGLIGLGYGIGWLRQGVSWRLVSRLAWSAAALLLPFVVGLAWVRFSDDVKSGNAMGQFLTSSVLGGWNYGTLGQRFSAQLWDGVVSRRILRDVFGTFGVWALLALLGAWWRPRAVLAVALCAIGFVTPILLFTNLHMVHNYYQYANGAFLLAALAIALGTLAGRRAGGAALAGVLLVVVVGAQGMRFHRQNMEWIRSGIEARDPYAIALLARERTPEGSALIFLGDDWSSTIPYYAQRRSLALPYWIPAPVMGEILRDTNAQLGGVPLGGIVDCMEPGPHFGALQPQVDALLAGRRVVAINGTCRLLSGERIP